MTVQSCNYRFYGGMQAIYIKIYYQWMHVIVWMKKRRKFIYEVYEIRFKKNKQTWTLFICVL